MDFISTPISCTYRFLLSCTSYYLATPPLLGCVGEGVDFKFVQQSFQSSGVEFRWSIVMCSLIFFVNCFVIQYFSCSRQYMPATHDKYYKK